MSVPQRHRERRPTTPSEFPTSDRQRHHHTSRSHADIPRPPDNASRPRLAFPPPQVAKTRLQLDGELQSRASSQPGAQPYKRVYNNALDALAKTYKTEGIKGLSRGLTSAYAYQVFLNGSRLGLYEPFRRTLNKALGKGPNDQSIGVNLTSGASSGVVGAVLGNPLFLVKARMQAYSPTNPVGAQHCYKSPLQALIHIFKTEGGVRGLYRGVDAAMLRTAMGSSVSVAVRHV